MSLSTVKLPVKVGSASCQKTVLLDFVVVDTENWPYNALLGQPFLNKAKAVTVTYALMMKFPTEYGVGVVKGSQEMARRSNLSVFRDREDKEGHQVCAILPSEHDIRKSEDRAEIPKEFKLDMREEPENKKDEPTEDVILDDSEPIKVVKIGTNLQETIKANLICLLREYKDEFAWSHKVMSGIDTKIISHYLAINLEF